jgi:transposase
MAGPQQELFAGKDAPDGTVAVNARCLVRTQDGHRVVLVAGIVLCQYAVGDRMAEAHAMVSLVEQGWAEQREVATAFGCASRTVRRLQRRFEVGGLPALARAAGYPAGRPRLPRSRSSIVSRLKAHGHSNREIARRLGVNEKAVRKVVARLGWPAARSEQAHLPLPVSTADPNLSAGRVSSAVSAVEPVTPSAAVADPNLSAAGSDDDCPTSFDTDPADRSLDRLFARLGLLDDAAPLFRDGGRVPRAGVLLALPALMRSGVFDVARRVYGSIGPAFYGLRTTVVALLLLALLRIKRPEGLKEHSPVDLGRLLGLDRAPEVKTLRRKLSRLAHSGGATLFGHLLAERRVATLGAALGFLYVDGHVRVYHGQRDIPKAHVARMRIALPATTDYWANDARGEPLFVVTADANAGMVAMLPKLLAEIRALVGERRVTVVFDRGGWSPKLFADLLAASFDFLTYRKGRFRRLPRRCFEAHSAVLDGKSVSYKLADQGIRLLGGKLRLRQVTRLADQGRHQTPIVTSRRDLPAVEVAFRMFERWRQENFFKYLREEFALDALIDHGIVPDDATREVPNPRWTEIDAKLRAARDRVAVITRRIGGDAALRELGVAKSRRALLDRHTRRELGAAIAESMKLERRRAAIPRRIPVGERSEGEVVKLSTERKHLSNVLKMVAYQAESDLVRALAPHYRRAEDEGRTLVQSALASAADITVATVERELRVVLAPMSSPHRTRAIAALCQELTAAAVVFPGTRLRLVYSIASANEGSKRTA